MRVWGMRPGVSITLFAADRRRLNMIVGDRNAPQKHVWRAEIVLLSAGGLGTVEIMRRTGKSKTCVWRWQERFAEVGSVGCCATRPVPRGGAHRPGRGLTATEPPREANPLDRSRHGRGGRHQRVLGAVHPE